MLDFYEGSLIEGGYLVDALANGGSESDTVPSEIKPNIYNGAIYYDKLPDSLSIDDYYKNLAYSLQQGSSTLGYLGCDSELGTGYLDSIGSYGVMFDVTSLVAQDSEGNAPMASYAEIYGMDLYIRNTVRLFCCILFLYLVLLLVSPPRLFHLRLKLHLKCMCVVMAVLNSLVTTNNQDRLVSTKTGNW